MGFEVSSAVEASLEEDIWMLPQRVFQTGSIAVRIFRYDWLRTQLNAGAASKTKGIAQI